MFLIDNKCLLIDISILNAGMSSFFKCLKAPLVQPLAAQRAVVFVLLLQKMIRINYAK